MSDETRAAVTPAEYLKGLARGHADTAGEISLLNAVIRETRGLLSEALDLCVRARKLDEPVIALKEAWDRDSTMTRSATPALWVQDQYDTDLAEWEERARKVLSYAMGQN